MVPEILVCNGDALGAVLLGRFQRQANDALAERGRFALALTGGSVAATCLPVLASAGIDWTKVELFWGDERAVPPGDPESNFAAARALVERVPAERVHRMPADLPDLDAAARDYEARMKSVLGDPPALDFALLGMGPDGHVCSLFPDHPLLDERERFVAAVHDSPKPPRRRLTLTLPALAAARTLAVVVLGAAKAPMVKTALGRPGAGLPVARALGASSRALLFLDQMAAGLL